MAKINFGGVEEEVVTRDEFPLEKAREVLKNRIQVVTYTSRQGACVLPRLRPVAASLTAARTSTFFIAPISRRFLPSAPVRV